jgi:hypothetical protein
MVRLGGRVQPVDGIGGKAHGRIEAEGVRRLDDVVVDGLGNADEGDAALVELVGDRERAVSADDDERIELQRVERLDAALGIVARAARRLDRRAQRVPAIGGPQDRAADAEDAGDVARRQFPPTVEFEKTVEAVREADDLAVDVRRRLDDRADDRVQPGSIPAAGQDADPPHRRARCRLHMRASIPAAPTAVRRGAAPSG